MALADRLYAWLASTPDAELDRALGDALRRAEPAWASRIINLLVDRPCVSSWTALVGSYAKLTPLTRQRLLAFPAQVEEAIIKTLRSTDEDARVNALRCLLDEPNDRLLYMLPDALRDPAPPVRSLAASALRQSAERLHENGAEGTRGEVAQALQEAVRALDLHHHLELVEAALWYMRELSEEIWKNLNTYRSRLPLLLSERIHEWNKPQAARFFLEALTHPNWRTAAIETLARWHGPERLTAILRESDLLHNAEFCAALRYVRKPAWFNGLSETLSEAPAELRAMAPRWLVKAGFAQDDRVELLARWIESRDPELRRGAVFAAASLGGDAAERLLMGVAKDHTPLATFARWFLAGDAELVSLAPPSASQIHRADAPQAADEAPHIDAPAAPENEWFDLAWRACAAASKSAKTQLVAALAGIATNQHGWLKRRLHAADGHDRVLALEIVAAADLTSVCRDTIEHLLGDVDSAVRDRARAMLQALSTGKSTPTKPAASSALAPLDEDEQGFLRTLLKQIAAGDAPNDAAHIAGVCKMLRRALSDATTTEASA